MRLIKLAVISFVVFFILLTAMGSLFPSNVLVSRAVDISASPDSIRAYIDDYQKWNEWMEGAKESEYKVTSSDSVKAFYGNVIITLIKKEPNKWQHRWKAGKSIQLSSIQIISSGSVSTVQWQFEEHVKWYPWEKIGSMMNDKILGGNMEKSLANLKKIVEGN
ncbi:SRPBCC family protein [Danxiaibacter flavus]|uniref:SRPBCC family protein n=1 Tax=Danxiaibacter flavus TaxID=3049108 RepID=A0ABV3ZDU0_9BACT|nr:SRPBCC family protein [Chitinophagaceae bacterium DXS]